MAGPSFTYTADPQNSPLDAVRLILGDTNPDDVLLYDGEIAYFLGRAKNSVTSAAYLACGAIVAKLSRLCDERVGDVSLSLSQKMRGYVSLQSTLQEDVGQGASFFSGGISRVQVRSEEANPDRTPMQVPAEQERPYVDRPYLRPWQAAYRD